MSVQSARLLVISAAVLFSTGGAAIKIAAFSGMQVSAIRAGVAALALLVFVRGRVAWSWPAWGIGAVYAATLTLFVNATKLTTAANAIFLQSTAPFYIVILGPLLLRERLRPRDAAYLAAVGTGLALCFVARPAATATAPDPGTGNLLGMLCGITWAFTLVGIRWAERTRAGVGLSAVIAGNVLACLVGLPFVWPMPEATLAEWATLGYLGVFQIGFAYVCLTRAMAGLSALEASLLLLIEPVLNPVWTWLIRGERPGAWVLAGGAVIVAATAIRTLSDPLESGAKTAPDRVAHRR